MHLVNRWFAAFLAVLLAACGGTDGGMNNSG